MFLAQMPPPEIPDLPAGPALDRVRGPVDIPPFEAWQIGMIAALTAALLALLVWGIARWIRARRARAPALEPHSAALAELQTAAAHSADDDHRFAALSSLALRRYFQQRCGIPALEQTSAELLHSLQAHPQLNCEARAALHQFMQDCDRVKFAQASLSAAQRASLTASAQQLIQKFEASEGGDRLSSAADAGLPAREETMQA
jgi:hypothetical protein